MLSSCSAHFLTLFLDCGDKKFRQRGPTTLVPQWQICDQLIEIRASSPRVCRKVSHRESSKGPQVFFSVCIPFKILLYGIRFVNHEKNIDAIANVILFITVKHGTQAQYNKTTGQSYTLFFFSLYDIPTFTKHALHILIEGCEQK